MSISTNEILEYFNANAYSTGIEFYLNFLLENRFDLNDLTTDGDSLLDILVSAECKIYYEVKINFVSKILSKVSIEFRNKALFNLLNEGSAFYFQDLLKVFFENEQFNFCEENGYGVLHIEKLVERKSYIVNKACEIIFSNTKFNVDNFLKYLNSGCSLTTKDNVINLILLSNELFAIFSENDNFNLEYIFSDGDTLLHKVCRSKLSSSDLINRVEYLVANRIDVNSLSSEKFAIELLVENSYYSTTIKKNILEIIFSSDKFSPVKHKKIFTSELLVFLSSELKIKYIDFFLENISNEYNMHCSDFTAFGNFLELSGNINFNGVKHELEGMNRYDAINFMHKCFSNNHCDDVYHNIKNKVINMLAMANFFNFEMTKRDYDNLILDYSLSQITSKGLLICTGWPDHSITIFIKDNILYRCNGGGCAMDNAIEKYEICKTDNLKETVKNLYRDIYYETNKQFIQEELHKTLGLNLVNEIKSNFQSSGNCNIHSIILGMEAMIYDSEGSEAVAQFYNFYDEVKYSVLEGMLSNIEQCYFTQAIISRFVAQAHENDRKVYLCNKLFKNNQIKFTEDMLLEQIMKEWRLRDLNNYDNLKEHINLLENLKIYPFDKTQVFRESDKCKLFAHFMNSNDVDDIDLRLESYSDLSLQGFSLLHIAVLNDNIELAEKSLATIKDVNQEDMSGYSALSYAKSYKMVSFLVNKNNANVNACEEEDYSPLNNAIRNLCLDSVALLLNKGAQVNEYTPMFIPSCKDIGIIDLLHEKCPRVFQQRGHSYSEVMHYYVSSSDKVDERFIKILKSGAGINPSNVNGVTPLYLAIKNKKIDLAKAIIDDPRHKLKELHKKKSLVELASEVGEEGFSERVLQVKQEREEALAYYNVEFKTREEYKNLEGELQFLIAAVRACDSKAVAGCLIYFEHNNVSISDKLLNISPLHEAIRQGNIDIFNEFLKIPNVDFDSKTVGGESLLHTAVIYGRDEIVDILIAKGANINITDNIGVTPLMEAASKLNIRIVKKLLNCSNIDGLFAGWEGKNAYQMCLESEGVYLRNKYRICRLFEDLYPEVDYSVYRSRINLDHYDRTREQIAKGYCSSRGINKTLFDKYRKELECNDSDQVPKVEIEGKFGKNRYYCRRLNVEDLSDFALTLCLPLRKEIIIGGLSDINKGFYMVFKGDIENQDPMYDDTIVCGFFASRNDENGEFSLNRIEPPNACFQGIDNREEIIDYFGGKLRDLFLLQEKKCNSSLVAKIG